MKTGDFALIEWNGDQYTKSQHYHILEATKKYVKVRVPGSYIILTIPVKAIKKYEIINKL